MATALNRKIISVYPFVKWAGGKRQLLSEFKKYFPPVGSYKRYFEPFTGRWCCIF